MTAPTQAYTLQVGPIGRTERLAVMSWRQAGLDVTCFTYAAEPLEDLPMLGDAVYARADEIVPRETLRKCQHPQTAIGLFAAHALRRRGGLWLDPDYVLLRSLPSERFMAIARAHERGPIIRPNLLAVARQHPFAARMIDELWASDGAHARDIAVAKAMRLYWPKTGMRLNEDAYWPVTSTGAAQLYDPAPLAYTDGELGGVCCHRDAGPHGPPTIERILHPNELRQQDGATGDPCWYSTIWRHIFQLPGHNHDSSSQRRRSTARNAGARAAADC
jgi:hypothetical protein